MNGSLQSSKFDSPVILRDMEKLSKLRVQQHPQPEDGWHYCLSERILFLETIKRFRLNLINIFIFLAKGLNAGYNK